MTMTVNGTAVYMGRSKITSEMKSDDLRSEENVARIVNNALRVHKLNKQDIDYLMNYRNGVQPVLSKTKKVRDEINNKLVVNHAQMVTRMIVGYFLGTPIQYIQNGETANKDGIDKLNRYVAFEDKASVDKEIAEYQSITGTAYRIIYTDGIFADEVPFEDKALNPANTFVVYENTIAEKPLMGVTYHDILNDQNTVIGKRIYVYTDFGMYEIETPSTEPEISVSGSTFNFSPYNVGGVPIIEYPNNIWRIGDWELCLGMMDAINALHSGRLDDIDQIIQSLLIFVNADVDADTYDTMRERGVVLLKNTTNNKTEVDSISTSLDQTGMNLFAEEMEKLLYSLLSIPDRSQRSGGGDTGQAVELRDGWADLEVVARNKELVYKRSEKQALRIILTILNNVERLNISLVDVDIKFSRNKNNNLLVKAQSYSTLLATKTLSPADCLTIVDLVSDVNEYISRGEAFWGAGFAGAKESINRADMSDVALENAKNPPEPTVVGGEKKEPPKEKPPKE